MAGSSSFRYLKLECLEARENPSTTIWAQESFDTLPNDWTRKNSSGGTIGIVKTTGTGSTSQLRLSGPIGSTSRIWNQSVLPADYGASVVVAENLSTAVRLFINGQNLGTSKVSYIGVAIRPQGEFALFQSTNGSLKTLATIKAVERSSSEALSVSLVPDGDHLQLVVNRLGSGAYLNSQGVWQSEATSALEVANVEFKVGRAGLERLAKGSVRIDQFDITAPAIPEDDAFDTTASGSIPEGWQYWANEDSASFAAASLGDTSGQALVSAGTSNSSNRAWNEIEVPSDVTVQAEIVLNSLVPSQIFLRGESLDQSDAASYYAVSIERGLKVKLLAIVDGTPKELASLVSAKYVSGISVDVTFTAQQDKLQVRIQRKDTGEWLNQSGVWQKSEAAVLNVQDQAILTSGQIGFSRPASYAGKVSFDHLRISNGNTDITAPTIGSSIVATRKADGSITGKMSIVPTIKDKSQVDRVEYYIDGILISQKEDKPLSAKFDTKNLTNGSHQVKVQVWDVAGNVGERLFNIKVSNKVTGNPGIAQSYDHIRYAALAYNGNPMGDTEKKLLEESVDLVIPNSRYMETIESVSPDTPKLIYSNISNLYLNLYTDWLNYADKQKISRESAFYHVSEATSFTGASPSSQPVTWFWNVGTGSVVNSADYQNLTGASRDSATNDLTIGTVGQATTIAYPDRFREINITLSKAASSDWQGVWEYATLVNGKVVWKKLATASDTTQNWQQSGQVAFDPPSDWKATVQSGSDAALFYVRFRTTSGTEAPIASQILGRDYVNAKGQNAGTIPAFDKAADLNKDGYLNDAEYAQRQSGFDARFVYESRLFYPYYGQMRFVTNPTGEGVADWAADYHKRFLAENPLADGLFIDNSGGKSPIDGAKVIESTDAYSWNYAAILSSIKRMVSPKLTFANIAGGGASADQVVQQATGSVDEFVLRPMAATWSQFKDLANTVAKRLDATGSPYLVLDSLSQGGSPTDSRTRMGALAYYYLLADPTQTFFMAWGGEEPASAWDRHWWDAIAYDVGQPKGDWSQFASGSDPVNSALGYQVFGREYDNALVLYKPLSYTAGSGIGTTADTTATTHQLTGQYRLLSADGSLSEPTNTVTLRNGEGAILIKA
jgi:hypothetical protein